MLIPAIFNPYISFMNLSSLVLFENEAFVVLNKPAGLLSIPDREGKENSLKRMLQDKYGQIFTVHRIDRETSGVIVFAKNEDSHRFLSVAFEDRNVEKYYQGIVQGTLTEKEKTIDAPIMENPSKKGLMMVNRKGKPSTTIFRVLEEFGKYSLIEFRILTGRTHQIRVHMADYGHPIVCDPLYGDGKPILLSSLKKKFNLSKDQLEERPIMPRLALHAWKLKFKDEQGKEHEFVAPLPKDMRAFMAQLAKLK